MKNLLFVFALICSPFAFSADEVKGTTPATTSAAKFICHGTYTTTSGGLLVVPDMSATGRGDVSMEFMNTKIPCPSIVLDAKTIKMTCGAGSIDATVSENCKTLTTGGLPYSLKE